MRELLAHRDFRLLLVGQTLSMFGDWTLLLVFGIWAKTLTGSNAIAGLTVFAMAVPGLLAPFGGVLVDRLPRRTVMITLNLASALAVGTLWFVEDRRQLWLLFAVAVWYGFSSVVFNAAISGLLQAMLPTDLIGRANGLLATIRQGLRLVGPLVGAGLFALAGGAWVAMINATTFLLSTLALLALRHREPAVQRVVVPFRSELAAGLLHLWRTPLLRRLVQTTIMFSLVIGMVEPTVYAVVGDGLHRPPEFIGVLVSVQGLGAILGGVVVTAVIRRVAEPVLVVIGLLLAAAGAALCAVPLLPVVLAGFALVGAGLPVLGVAIATLLQRTTPPPMMGRVAAGYEVIGSVPTTASIAVGAVLVGLWPYQVIIGITALGCAAAAFFLLVGRRAGSAPTGQSDSGTAPDEGDAQPAATGADLPGG
ncbi:MAG TPA: MFS transporter [Microlunatus sp.]|nr:MFS transporter [Microlunatus sp.]